MKQRILALWLMCLSVFLVPSALGQAQFIPRTPEDLGLPGAYQNIVRAQAALARANQLPPQTAAPTVTYTTSTPSTTFFPAYDRTNVRVDPRYTYLNVVTPVQAGTAFPDYDAVRSVYLPTSPGSVLVPGNETVEFVTDAAYVTIPYKRSQNGSFLIYVDGQIVASTNSGIYGTAQAGASGSITLASGASASNGTYNKQWVYIESGTGAGQYRQVSGYVGSTKVASIVPNWTTPPDNTSVYAVTPTKTKFNSASSASTMVYVNLDFNGDSTFHTIRCVFTGFTFFGTYLPTGNSILLPAAPATGPPAYLIGDSFTAGTGAEVNGLSVGNVAALKMGWNPINLSIGGTGYLNEGAGLAIPDRITPPANAWHLAYSGGSGTIILTQSGTSVSFAGNLTAAQMRTAFDGAFGAGKFYVAGTPGAWWIIGKGTAAASTANFTIDLSGWTPGGINATVARYLGDLQPVLRKDSAGKVIPGYILFLAGHNDTADTSGSYTPALLQSTCTTLFQEVRRLYPTMTIIVVGNMYLQTSPAGANVTNANTAIYNAVVAKLPKINGNVAFINTLSPIAWISGTGNIGLAAGTGNANEMTYTDDIHPSPAGHQGLGYWISCYLARILYGQGGQ